MMVIGSNYCYVILDPCEQGNKAEQTTITETTLFLELHLGWLLSICVVWWK